MQVLRLEFELELTNTMLTTLLESNNLPIPELDAGKWYQRRLRGDS